MKRDRKRGWWSMGTSFSTKPVRRPPPRFLQGQFCSGLPSTGGLLHTKAHHMSDGFRFIFWPVSMAVSLVLFFGGCAQTPSVQGPVGVGRFSTVVIDADPGGKDSDG